MCQVSKIIGKNCQVGCKFDLLTVKSGLFYICSKKNKKNFSGWVSAKKDKKHSHPPPGHKWIHTGHIWDRISSSYSRLHIHNVQLVNVQIYKFVASFQASIFLRYGFKNPKNRNLKISSLARFLHTIAVFFISKKYQFTTKKTLFFAKRLLR